ncbi:VOC family protein [Streptomyces sp. NPDC002225]|uniref:VOC family protein n=1 Tax=Streptomyces sp. NPDC002225 TaxID=3154413 RepID=UPI003325B6AF
MTIHRLLAQMTVTDLDAATAWYTALLGRGPDARPMRGLIEWHLSDTYGIQVWAEPDRAGHSTVVLDESDLEGRLTRLAHAGIRHDGPRTTDTSRVLTLTDPDGNRTVFVAPPAPGDH